jgi:hypothetical protein
MNVAIKLIVLSLAAAATFGCANRPETIRASFVSHEKYADLNCTELAASMAGARAELDKFSKLQDSKANSDAVGVFLLGVPFSKLSGDHEADVARLKGTVEAIETAQVKAKCARAQVPLVPQVDSTAAAERTICVPRGRKPGDQVRTPDGLVLVKRILAANTICHQGDAAVVVPLEAREPAGAPVPVAAPAPARSKADRLRELKKLYEEKLISQEVYDAKQRELLDEK